jgi:tellurite resistance protein TerC
MFIGVKLIMTFLHEQYDSVPKIPTSIGLGVIAAILVISTVASLIKSKKDPAARAHAGTITGSEKDEE